MLHHRSLEGLLLSNTWVTIGSFDGIHRGHQALVQALVSAAHQAGSEAVVITFYPHPAVVLRGTRESYYLNTPEEQAELLESAGVDHLITLEFNQKLAASSAADFMTWINRALGINELWIGHDFTLGHDREGNQAALIAIGKEIGYRVKVIPPALQGGEIISSSRIRQLLTNGDVSRTACLLGRWYSLKETIIGGDRRGRTLGFPTANLVFPVERVLPAPGVYATLANLGDKRLEAVTNVGYRPTFKNQSIALVVEAHILDFNQDIYGQSMRLDFIRFLRSEVRFAHIQELIHQMQKDIETAREVLSHVKSPTDLPIECP